MLLRLLQLLPLVASFIPHSHAQMPIPKREVGFVYNGGHPDALIKLDFYIDSTCSDSKAAYPTLLKVADHFGPSTVQLKVHLMSLPYHRNSHVVAKGAHVLDKYNIYNNSAVFAWFGAVYDKLDSLTTTATQGLTDKQVLDILVPLAKQASGIAVEQFREQVYEDTFDNAARLGWKYGATRGIYATPLFMVNDVLVQADQSWTVDQWKDLIMKLLV